jgi:hypothetical protein
VGGIVTSGTAGPASLGAGAAGLGALRSGSGGDADGTGLARARWERANWWRRSRASPGTVSAPGASVNLPALGRHLPQRHVQRAEPTIAAPGAVMVGRAAEDHHDQHVQQHRQQHELQHIRVPASSESGTAGGIARHGHEEAGSCAYGEGASDCKNTAIASRTEWRMRGT